MTQEVREYLDFYLKYCSDCSMNEIILSCFEFNIPILGVKEIQTTEGNRYVGYEIRGFSKLKSALIWEDNDKIKHCKVEYLYSIHTDFLSFNDLALEALKWNVKFLDECGWDKNWLPYFITQGWAIEDGKGGYIHKE